jgi:hypothetical protein
MKANNSKFKKRINDKIRHKVEDLHWKTVNLLCERFDTILIGNMSTRGIVG